MNMAPISDPNTMMPATAATQKIGRAATVQVVEGVGRPALTDDERGDRDARPTAPASPRVPLVGHHREVDADDDRPDHQHRQDAAEVVDRVGRLVDVGRHELEGHREGDDGERQGDEEHRAPPPALASNSAREQRAESGDGAADRRPERDRLGATGARPQRRDERQRGRVGHARPRGPPRMRAATSISMLGAQAAMRQAGTDSATPSEQHQLAAVAVAERTQPEHRRGQPERVADRHHVELGLRRVEGLADVGQGHVGHRERQVGDRGDEDQRAEDGVGALVGDGGGIVRRFGLGHRGAPGSLGARYAVAFWPRLVLNG
jgi:hypothetical protein